MGANKGGSWPGDLNYRVPSHKELVTGTYSDNRYWVPNPLTSIYLFLWALLTLFIYIALARKVTSSQFWILIYKFSAFLIRLEKWFQIHCQTSHRNLRQHKYNFRKLKSFLTLLLYPQHQYISIPSVPDPISYWWRHTWQKFFSNITWNLLEFNNFSLQLFVKKLKQAQLVHISGIIQVIPQTELDCYRECLLY